MIVAARNPSNTVDTQYAAGYLWLASLNMYQVIGGVPTYGSGNLYYQAGTSAGVPNWILIGNVTGFIQAVVGTANQITVVTTAGTATISLPSAITTPGSLTTTTSLTAGTGLTVTTGNATISGTGSGLVLTPVIVGAGASPQTANGRVFSVTFSGVSIAAGATQSFVIANTAVNTLVQVSMVGATSGSALSIQSITNSAGVSTTIVVTNGTGATTTTANITFTGFCVN
jgi:hypothetical protein